MAEQHEMPPHIAKRVQEIQAFGQALLNAENDRSMAADAPLTEEGLRGFRTFVKMVKDFNAMAQEYGVKFPEPQISGRVNLVVRCDGCGKEVHRNINVPIQDLDEIGVKYPNILIRCTSCGTSTPLKPGTVDVRGYTQEEIEKGTRRNSTMEPNP